MRLNFAAILLAASLANAQTTAEITGRVVDPSKAAVPGATITALNIDKKTERTTTSNDQGFYTFNSLDTGAYQISVQLAGFKALTRGGIKLDVNQSLRLDFALEVGQFSEKVQVVGEIATIEANTAQLGTVMTEEKIADLPLNARNFSGKTSTPIRCVVCPPALFCATLMGATPGVNASNCPAGDPRHHQLEFLRPAFPEPVFAAVEHRGAAGAGA